MGVYAPVASGSLRVYGRRNSWDQIAFETELATVMELATRPPVAGVTQSAAAPKVSSGTS